MKRKRSETNLKTETKDFGKVNDQTATLYVVTDELSGFEVSITDFGATLVDVKVPDKSGKCSSVMLSHTNAEEYNTHPSYFGASVGRVANRIENGEFTLEGIH